jgi:hypothetical protein
LLVQADDQIVGRVLGTEDSTPLEFWVGIEDGAYLQLDDVVMVRTQVPGAGSLRVSGIVDMVRAHHEGSRFDTDVFLAHEGLLPLETARAAHVVSTRFEPELYVPPQPGDAVVRVIGNERDEALYFDTMDERLVAGVARDSLPVFVDLSFLDGRRACEHLRRLGHRDEDHLRELSALRALSQRRPRQRGGEHQGADLQREGRGPAVPRQAERQAER